MYDYKKLSRSIIEENFDPSVLAQFDGDAAKHFRLWEATPSVKGKKSDEVKSGTGLEDPSTWDPENIELYLKIAKAAYEFCKQAWKDYSSKEASQLSDEEIKELNNNLEEELKKSGISKKEAEKIAAKSLDNLKEM